tara:strand:+ start:1864 stop:2574 length:711 start_codon:yes stop_codon:yes gene_type:complete
MEQAKSQTKSLLLAIKFLKNELESCIEICEKSNREMMLEITSEKSSLNVRDEHIDKSIEKEPKTRSDRKRIEKEQDDSELSKDHIGTWRKSKNRPGWAKSIYRKVAMMTHPDRLSAIPSKSLRHTLSEMYQDCVSAYKDGDYVGMLEVASDLNIDISSVPEEQISEISKRKSEIEKKIAELKSSYQWAWAHADEKTRKWIISEVVKVQGWTSRSGSRRYSRKGNPGKSLAWARKKW